MNSKPHSFNASVIIPSYNHKRYVCDLLDSLIGQITTAKYEIIVIDSGTDGTTSLIRSKYPAVRVLNSSARLYPGEARDKGIQASHYEILLLTDCDCIVSPKWIDTMEKGILSGSGIVVGPVMNGTPVNIIGTTEYLLNCFDSWNHRSNKKIGPAATLNVCLTRSIYNKYGPFDSCITGEDSRFFRRAQKNGETIYWYSNARVWHRNRTNLCEFMQNQYNSGLGAARTGMEFKCRNRVILENPCLIPLIPILKSIRIGWVLLKKATRYFPLFILLYPLLFAGLCSYSIGFAKGTSIQQIQGHQS